MKISRIVIFLWLLISAHLGIAQKDIAFVQDFTTPIALSPSYAGQAHRHRFVIGTYDLELGSFFGPNVTRIGYDVPTPIGGFGLLFQDIREDVVTGFFSEVQQEVTAHLSYSHDIRFTKDFWLVPGLEVGYLQRGLLVPFSAGTETQSTGRLDLGLGLMVKTSLWEFGIAGRHLNRPNLSLERRQVESTFIRVTAHGSTVFIPTHWFRVRFNSAIHWQGNETDTHIRALTEWKRRYYFGLGAHSGESFSFSVGLRFFKYFTVRYARQGQVDGLLGSRSNELILTFQSRRRMFPRHGKFIGVPAF